MSDERLRLAITFSHAKDYHGVADHTHITISRSLLRCMVVKAELAMPARDATADCAARAAIYDVTLSVLDDTNVARATFVIPLEEADARTAFVEGIVTLSLGATPDVFMHPNERKRAPMSMSESQRDTLIDWTAIERQHNETAQRQLTGAAVERSRADTELKEAQRKRAVVTILIAESRSIARDFARTFAHTDEQLSGVCIVTSDRDFDRVRGVDADAKVYVLSEYALVKLAKGIAAYLRTRGHTFYRADMNGSVEKMAL